MGRRTRRNAKSQGCRYCGRLLLPCPLGPACPGSAPGHPEPCTQCHRGVVCPVHGRGWPDGHRRAS